MGPGRCQNSAGNPGPCFGEDSYFANVKPNGTITKSLSLTVEPTESTCAYKCSNTPSCTSIFFEKTTGTCSLYDTVFAEKERLVPFQNTSHFRFMSGEWLQCRPLTSNTRPSQPSYKDKTPAVKIKLGLTAWRRMGLWRGINQDGFADVTVAIFGPWRLYSKSEWHMAFHPKMCTRLPVLWRAASLWVRSQWAAWLWVRSRWAAWLWVRSRFLWRAAWYILRDGRPCAILRVGWDLVVTGSGAGGRGSSCILQHRLPTVLAMKSGSQGHGSRHCPSTEPWGTRLVTLNCHESR